MPEATAHSDISDRPPLEHKAWEVCPVCEEASRSPWIEFTELAFSRCSGCGAVYKSRESQGVRDGDFYEEQYFHGRKSARDKRFEHRVRKCCRQILRAQEYVTAQSVLDVGCSLGYVIEAGKRLGLRAAGTDISEYAVRTCQERGYDAQVGTLHSIPYPDEHFDIVVMKHVLEHTPDPLDALREVSRLLTPDGALVVVVPDLQYWKGLFWKRRGRYFRPNDLGRQHYVYYSTRSLKALLHRAGFDVRTTSKAVFRRKHAGKNPIRWVGELFRYVTVACFQSCARALLQQRELYFVATRRDSSCRKI